MPSERYLSEGQQYKLQQELYKDIRDSFLEIMNYTNLKMKQVETIIVIDLR